MPYFSFKLKGKLNFFKDFSSNWWFFDQETCLRLFIAYTFFNLRYFYWVTYTVDQGDVLTEKTTTFWFDS